MVFLDHFVFASQREEEGFLGGQKRTCYDTFYPFQIFTRKEFERIDFTDITILYGGNGSGKSTALNLIADKIGANRTTVYNRSNFFEDYLDFCRIEYEDDSCVCKEIITSDGVFDSMLDIRNLNSRIDVKREDAFDEYLSLKNAKYDSEKMQDLRLHPLENFELLKKKNISARESQSRFVRETVPDNVREYSNGESAFEYFISRITENGIYILDEPENSLSPERQIKLVKYLEESVRYCRCQLIIATHSPLILAMRGAKIYDLDADPVDVRRWTELENVRIWYDFFMAHKSEFDRRDIF